VERPELDWRSLDAPASDRAPEDDADASGLLPRRWIAPLALLLVAIALAGAALLTASAPQAEVVVGGGAELRLPDASGGLGAGAADPVSSAAADAVLVVDVEGAVERPGVYRLAAGSRLADAVEAAGGFSPGVDAAAARSALNLAARLEDGQQIVVPGLGDPAPPSSGPSGSSQGGGLIDLNRATAQQLESLPGIGPVTSGKIIAARETAPFQTVDELLSRKLVSSSTFEKVRTLVTVGG
jgi:competence protein ComEA